MEKRRLNSYYGVFARRKWREEMLNGEKFKKEIEDVDFDIAKCKGKIVNCRTTNCTTCDFYDKERECNFMIVKWLLEEYKEPILNEEEKKILNDLIELNKKLTNSKFLYVTKLITNNNNYSKCYLYLTFENCNICDTVAFYSNTIFKRMEINKQYSLEELGLC